MDRNLVLLNQNNARLRRDVEIEQLIAADFDCTSAAQLQADLVLLAERRERLMEGELKDVS
jgi:hypothetical protein